VKKVLFGTLLLLVILVVALIVFTRWPALFWMTVLALLLYLAFGRRADVEFQVGIRGKSGERRVYLAVVWQRQAAVIERSPRVTTNSQSGMSSQATASEVEA
jgi:hypothetical protein